MSNVHQMMDDNYVSTQRRRLHRADSETLVYSNDRNDASESISQTIPEQQGPIKAYVDFTEFNIKYQNLIKSGNRDLESGTTSALNSPRYSSKDATDGNSPILSSHQCGDWEIIDAKQPDNDEL